MFATDYVFLTRWHVPDAFPEEIAAILADIESLPRWWPAVYLDARLADPGDATGRGPAVDLRTKGWLPYHLRWRCRQTEARWPTRFQIEAEGDLSGSGVWTLRRSSAGRGTDIAFDWRVRADKPLLRYLSFLLRPIFTANHRWAMAQGERSLRLELARRRARTPAELFTIPAPPRPVGPTVPALAAAALALLIAGIWRAGRRLR